MSASPLLSAEIRHTCCNICSSHCGLDAYVERGKLVRVEAARPPFGSGSLCPKGYANRGYLYRDDRIKTPLRRTGKRGEGLFEPISWEEAYGEIAEKLGAAKRTFGPDSVAFYTGYSKWYRPYLHRFVHAFGTLNYGTESSSCFQSSFMANEVNAGVMTRPDLARSELFVAWGSNPFHGGNYGGQNFDALKERGLKILLIDPRVTPFSSYADLQLRIKPGTDGALALYFAKRLIEEGRADLAFIERHVHGFPEFAAYAAGFGKDRTSRITGLSPAELEQAEALLFKARRFSMAAGGCGNIHHINGFQSLRAILSLSALTGNFDREGGNIPLCHIDEERNKPNVPFDEFIDEKRPRGTKPKIGSERFPLWSDLVDEYQAMDLSRQILEGTPYHIEAVFALGMNVRMFPGNARLFEALEKVPFYADVDLFMTDSARYADIVLPACSSFEREELVESPQGVRLIRPVIEPLGEARSDAVILCDLAEKLELNDPIMRGGYKKCVKYLIRTIGVTYEDLCSSAQIFRIPGKEPYLPGSVLQTGFGTPTGKYELYSERIRAYPPSYGYEPLPVYAEPLEEVDDPEKLPLTLVAGGRLPFAFHSRFHRVKWARELRRDAAVDVSPQDAKALGIGQGDAVILESAHASIRLRANLTYMAPPGAVFLFQGYSEADVNSIVGINHLDPYSGFPGFRSVRCALRRCGS
ncbi:MAG: molybdopterin-dependent oxidoreductase [Clostridiales Family XIII bacterium]|nr:molybdopterin-dependent oxidoreductase [Clostridiales Family XIII bacterium]